MVLLLRCWQVMCSQWDMVVFRFEFMDVFKEAARQVDKYFDRGVRM